MKKIPLLLVLLLVIVLSSCKKDNNSNPSTKTVRFITEKDTFNNDVIWYPDTIYCIKCPISIKGSLTIRPGTIIKLDKMASLSLVDIIAVGTETNPIIFTSIYDDEHGGDSDGDEGVITPETGTWNNIGFEELFSARFEYCEFYYGGSLFIVPLTNSSVKNCVFAHNKGMFVGMISFDYALFIYNITAGAIPSYSFECSNNLFYDNTKPLGFVSPYSVDSTNTFTYEGTGNKMNGIFFFSKIDKFNNKVDLLETEIPYVFEKDLKIIDGGKIEFADGAIVKCSEGVTITIDPGGKLNSIGHDVTFTSIKDDEHGGDTNGDSDGSTPNIGDWKGIYDNNLVLNRWWKGSNILYDETHNLIITPSL